MTRAVYSLIAIVGCRASSPPVPIAAHALPSTTASCALPKPERTKIKRAFHAWLGVVGDRSWVMLDRGEHELELVTLGGDGKLAETVLPIERPINLWWQLDGAHLWLEASRGKATSYYDVDLATATPTVHVDTTVEPRALGAASSFTVDATRVLFYSFARWQPGPGFELWDREHGKTLAMVPQELVGIDEPPKRCVRDRCFAIPVLGDGPTRRLTAFRFAPDGALTKLQLADDHLYQTALVPDGDRTHVLWTSFSRQGLFARTLDDTGSPTDDEILLAPSGNDPQLVTGDPAQLAFKDDKYWHVATLAPDGRSFARDTTLPLGGSFLTAAPTREGLLAIGFTSDASIDTAVPPTKAGAVFVPAGDAPGGPIDGRDSLPAGSAAAGQRGPIDVMFGEKHTSWVPFPLVSPGYAAVLLVTQGYGDPDGELVMLREPCAR